MHFLVAFAPKIHVQLEFSLVSKIDLASASRAVCCAHRSLRNPRQQGRPAGSLTSRQTNSHSVSPSPYFCSDEKLPPAFTRGGGGMKLPELLLLLVLNKAAAESGSPLARVEAEEVTLIHLAQVGSIVDILAPVAGLGE